MIDSISRKDENYYQVFLEKDYLIEDIEIFCSNSDEECISLFLETLKIRINMRNFFKLGTLKFPPKI